MSNGSKVIWSLRALTFIYIVSGLPQQSTAFECNGHYLIQPGIAYSVQSPNYPNSYSPYSQSICKFTAPRFHNIEATCYIDLDKGPDPVCTTEKFFISEEGDIKFRGSEQLCGRGSVKRASLFRSIAFGHISGGSRGRYQCLLEAKPQSCDCGWSMKPKISNGVETAVNEFPSIVAYDVASGLCSGSIISYRHILTAAHCIHRLNDPNNVVVTAGRHDLTSRADTRYATSYEIGSIIIHPNYNEITTKNDIAIMVTKIDIEFSKGVGPICLPPYSNIMNNFEYSPVEIVGWGATKFAGTVSPKLQKANVLVVPNSRCQEVFSTTDATQLCTSDQGGKLRDSCQSDSGGPVIYNNIRQVLVGIISYGLECGVKKYGVSINTRITSNLVWIHQNTDGLLCPKMDQYPDF